MRKKHILRRFAYLDCRISGEDVLHFLQLCGRQSIVLYHLTRTEEGYTCTIRLDSYVRARHLRYLTGVHIEILKKRGFPYALRSLLQRKIFLCGGIFCILLWCFLSGHIWEIRFTGNLRITNETLLRYLRTEHVQSGMKKKDADTQAIASGLRSAFPDFVWVAAEISGTVLYIRIEEARKVQEKETPTDDSSLYADKEGDILALVTRKGISRKAPGDHVYPGDLLVSGEIPLYDDGMNITGYTYCGADADILLATEYVYYDRIMYAHLQPVYEKSRFCGIQAGIADTQLRLWQKPTTGELTADIYPLAFSRDCPLPVTLTVYSVRPCRYVTVRYTQAEAAVLLQKHFSEFFVQLAKKVMRITENNVKIALYQEYAVAYGRLSAKEYTGVSQATPKTSRKDQTLDD